MLYLEWLYLATLLFLIQNKGKLMKNFKLTIFASFAFVVLSLLLVGFVDFKSDKNQLQLTSKEKNYDYIYVGKQENNINVIIKQIYKDNDRKIELLQIKGHEYIVYRSNYNGAPAMVHSQSCYSCDRKDKNEK